MYDSRQWSFISDMNNSGSITISDVWLWFQWIYFYPGDWVISILVNTETGRFLEISYGDYGGFLAGVISFFVWLALLVIIGIISTILEDD